MHVLPLSLFPGWEERRLERLRVRLAGVEALIQALQSGSVSSLSLLSDRDLYRLVNVDRLKKRLARLEAKVTARR